MKKKKITVVVLPVIVILILSFVVGTGFTKNPQVDLVDYTVSSDGTEVTLNVGSSLYIGQIRGFKDTGGGVKPHYLDFYHTFGFVSSWGANYEYVLELDETDTEIYFNRADGGYELVLQKNTETGEWIRP